MQQKQSFFKHSAWNLSKHPFKRGLLFCGLFILVGLIIAATTTKHLVHPVTHWVIISIISVAYAIFCIFYFYKAAGEDMKKIWIHFFVASLIFFVLVYGVGLVSKDSREQCIPKEKLVAMNGHIFDAAKYVEFHRKCPGNNFLFDAPTVDYIKKNHRLPSWIMLKNGYTSDPVGWWQWFSIHPQNPYDLNHVDIDQFYASRYLPAEALESSGE